jgi:hypothetical protein
MLPVVLIFYSHHPNKQRVRYWVHVPGRANLPVIQFQPSKWRRGKSLLRSRQRYDALEVLNNKEEMEKDLSGSRPIAEKLLKSALHRQHNIGVVRSFKFLFILHEAQSKRAEESQKATRCACPFICIIVLGQKVIRNNMITRNTVHTSLYNLITPSSQSPHSPNVTCITRLSHDKTPPQPCLESGVQGSDLRSLMRASPVCSSAG